MEKTIVITIDDTLNNFSTILSENTRAFFRAKIGSATKQVLNEYLYRLDTGELTDFGRSILASVQARETGVEFINWLRAQKWRIILWTGLDLRFAATAITNWLAANKITYDYLFRTDDILKFCRDWEVDYLIGKSEQMLTLRRSFSPNQDGAQQALKVFDNFEEVKQWIRK